MSEQGIFLKENRLKFQQVEAFEKHLKEAFPDHLSKIYFIACAEAYERKSLIDRIIAILYQRGECQVIKESLLCNALMHLNHVSLFSTYTVVIVDHLEIGAIKESSEIEKYLINPAPTSYLILAACSEKPLHDLYLKGKKEVVMLDLSGEKPWVRKQRLKNTLALLIKNQGKSLAPHALEFLLEHLPLDLSLMEQEVMKLSSFVGDRKEISLEDIQQISTLSKTAKSWQIAEALVWEGNVMHQGNLESSELFLLIGQIRYHLELGLKLSSLLYRGTCIDHVKSCFSEIKPISFEKYLSVCQKRGRGFFKEGLIFLFEFEFAMKNSLSSPILLFDLFRSKLEHL